MAESTDAPTPAASGYVLNFPTDGTSFGVRENLVDILERELLGPIHGEESLLPFMSCRADAGKDFLAERLRRHGCRPS